MSNVTWTQVQSLQSQIPETSEDRIKEFITDHEYVVKAKLASYVEPWTDVTEPGIVKVIIKHLACWTELSTIYGSQVEEYHEFIRDFRTFPWDLLHEIIDDAKEGRKLPSGFTALEENQLRLNTKLFTKIFDLGDVYSQTMHSRDDDIRYGEDT